MSQKQCDDREEESGEHIAHLQDLAEGRVDADTENEGGSYKRKLRASLAKDPATAAMAVILPW